MDTKLSSILRNSILISDVIGDYITLSKKGKNFFGLCPFHNDSNPSLVVNNEKQYFKCFVCGEGGDLISFIVKKENIPFTKAIVNLAKKYGIETKEIHQLEKKFQISQEELDFYEMNLQAKEIYHNFLMQKENLKIRKYLYSRGIEEIDLKKFQIGYAPKQKDFLINIMSNRTNIFGPGRDSKLIWDLSKLLNSELIFLNEKEEYQDFFLNRIIFPIQDEWKRTVGFSGRAIDELSKVKYINSKTSKFFKKDCILYNMENVWNVKSKKIFITEGFIDVILTSKNGIENIVGTMGLSLSINHIQKIKKQNFETVIISMDNDRAGTISNMKMGRKIIKFFKNTMIVKKYDKDCKDLADLSNKLKNSNNFLNAINNYTTYIEYLILTIFENKNKTIDVNLTNFKKVAKEIFYFGDIALKNYYAKLLAEKSGFLENDAINTIESFNNKNFLKTNDKKVFLKEFIENDLIFLDLEKTFSNNQTKNVVKLANFEKQLILIMINNFEVADFFIKNLNQINYLENNKDYLIAFKIIRNLVNKNQIENSKSKIIKLIESHVDKSLNIINDINSYTNNLENFNFIQEKERGLNIIKELIKAQIKLIESKQALKLNNLYAKKASLEEIAKLKNYNEIIISNFKNYDKKTTEEIKKTRKKLNTNFN